MNDKNVVLIGATGLIGSHLLTLLLQDTTLRQVRALVRRGLDVKHEKLTTLTVDFTDATALAQAMSGCEAVFCSIGTTMQQVKGDKAAYRKIDYDIPVLAAQVAAQQGVRHFVLVSSVGADAQSSNFYLQLKGSVEEAIKALPIPAIHIFRPSMLLGDRKEFRLGERIGKSLMQVFGFLTPANYKAVAAASVAKAMLAAIRKTPPPKGVQVYHYPAIMSLQ